MVVGSIPTLGATRSASIAQLGERKTEDLEVPCSIHGRSNTLVLFFDKQDPTFDLSPAIYISPILNLLLVLQFLDS